MTTIAQPHSRPQATGRSHWRIGLVASGLSAAVNALLFLGAYAAGVFSSVWLDPAAGAQMSVEPVILVSVIAPLAAVGVFGLMARAMAQPLRPFLVLAGVLLLASFAAPLAIPGTGLAQALVLNAMHVVVAATVVGLLVRARG